MSLERFACGVSDWVTAAGLAARALPADARKCWTRRFGSENVIEAGLYFTRVMAGDVRRDDAIPVINEVVRFMDTRYRWSLTSSQERRVAECVWMLLTQPRCTTCRGQQIAPHICPSCGGSGNREVPRRNKDEISRVLSMISWIQSVTEQAVKEHFG